MKKILIDINHNQVNISNVIQGIKLFNHSEKIYRITAVGREEDMLTIKDLKDIETIYADDIYSGIDDLENSEVSLTKCFQLLSNETSQYDAFISSAPSDVIKAYAEKYLKRISKYPTIIGEYPNAFTGRKTALLDLGYDFAPSATSLIEMQKLGQIYTKKVLYSQNFSFKLLTSTRTIELEDEITRSADTYFKKIEGYKGLLKIKDIFSPDCKLVVGQSSIISTLSQATHTMFDLYEKYIDQAVSADFKTKIGSKLMNSTFRQINSSIDKKFTSGGTVLLGYNKNIVIADSSTTSLGFKSSIVLAKTLVRCKMSEILENNEKNNDQVSKNNSK